MTGQRNPDKQPALENPSVTSNDVSLQAEPHTARLVVIPSSVYKPTTGGDKSAPPTQRSGRRNHATRYRYRRRASPALLLPSPPHLPQVTKKEIRMLMDTIRRLRKVRKTPAHLAPRTTRQPVMIARDIPKFTIYRIEADRWRFTNFKGIAGECDTHAEALAEVEAVVRTLASR